ncbi:hypothetical protein F441_03676 [Phytophthora nicotianae CJ01A1]|uniref:Mid2 domain-containing protein n=4 Tax=Phytophthora nicotianae TaxID=4792 RepID=W2QLQ3_PHYN3|nr:hypothetical protein PPTG_08527 [Phytophthora nicotianae INRA-310]ETL46625.1 hypothetical protein L916_03525 [Phytophthora nicotianae]ETN13826.1 hypothetical protein PPTG_08527 [Phytophthora nicotianae INRA-310]ETP23151.1 hypothetical protein F441_03676 [Phytophthora nicotianae CJ01A1]ETP51163.1 hypothetical protein F442_03660 [Phytophthora nicotianae P10297]
MKLYPVLASALAVACVATSGLTIVASQEVAGLSDEAGFAPVVGQEVKLTPSLRRHLQTSGSGTTEAPTTTEPTPTTATPTTTSPTPTTATPTTTAPTPTTATPTPTTDAPTPTTATPTTTTETTDTPEATTATPTSTTATPEATTATPTSTTQTTDTPSSTTAAPTAASTTSSTSSDTTTTPSATDNATTSNSGSSASAGTDTSSDSSMSTGAVIGIVVGIVAAVAIIATIVMCIIRRRREADDDPLSPFELSMDKGYNPTPGAFTAQNSYNPRAMGATGASASGSNTRTPPADTVAAGVAYSQFYDNAATSPDSMNRLESNVDSVQTDPGNPNATNGTNLWLSAMEPKDNDSYLSAQESPRSSRNSSRNSYELSSTHNVDADQSSQLSGHSNNKSDDFPDHHDDNDSARGSYEL